MLSTSLVSIAGEVVDEERVLLGKLLEARVLDCRPKRRDQLGPDIGGQVGGCDHIGHLDHGAVGEHVVSPVPEGRHVGKHLQPFVGKNADRLEQAFLNLPERFRRF